jgi:hypothetical protein
VGGAPAAHPDARDGDTVRRADFLRNAGLTVAFPGAVSRGQATLREVRVEVDGEPFAGDRALLATVSTHRRSKRRRAIVAFRLDRPARVRLDVVRTDTIRIGRPSEQVVWTVERQFRTGAHTLAWQPPAATPPRTYVLRLTAWDGRGNRTVFDAGRPGTRRRLAAPVVRVQGIEAGFARASYAPGETGTVTIAADAQSLELQVFRYGGVAPGETDLHTNAVAMTPPVRIDWSAHANAPASVRLVRAGRWPSGLYFLRLTSDDGRTGYAPFILRPAKLGTARAAVVLSTNTWQAYNFHDRDGDGWGDSWYVSGAIKSIDVTRPFLDFGVPFRFKDWDLTFIAWLNRTRKKVDFLADEDLDRVATGDELRRAYDVVLFPGHAEYVTAHAYDVVDRFRDLGGNLGFLAANNFFWSVVRKGNKLVKGPLWRDLGRPESRLVGTQYVGSDNGQKRAPYTVTGVAAAPWLFDGTGLADGSTFGSYGIEVDARSKHSPAGTLLLAHAPDLMGPGRSAEMTYYETPRGARVFSAGAIDFAASIEDPRIERLLENLWARLSTP